MPTREELHRLIDSLPEGAMEAVQNLLIIAQVWPPPPPTDRGNMIRMTEVRTAAGTKAGSSSWDGDTYVAETHRGLHGHELTIVERLRVDGQRLIYKHEATGPGDKRDEREVVFELPSV